MDLSIAVVHWNTSDLLVQCLQAVVDDGTELDYGLTVADNASTDADVRQIAKRFPRFRWFFSSENKGALILNEILSSIQGRYILFLSPDAQIKPGCLQAMVRFLDSHTEAGAVSGLLLNRDGSVQHYYRRLPKPWTYFFCRTPLGERLDRSLFNRRFMRDYEYEGLRLDSVVAVEQPPGTCLMVRTNLVKDRDGHIIDPRFPFYFNDVDLCKRVHDAGFRIFVLPAAKVIHHHGASFSKREMGWRRAESYVSLLRYFGKYYRYWSWVFYVYFVSEIALSLCINLTRLILAPRDKQLRGKNRDLFRVWLQVATLS